MPPQPAKSGGSFAGKMFTALAVTLLGCSLTLNFWLLFFGGLAAMAGGQGPSKSEVLVDGDITQQVYQIEVNGVIDDNLQKKFHKLLKRAADDTSTKALLVKIDSPGGTVTASDEIYRELKNFVKERNIPLVIEQGGLATSGGYYISAAGDKVFASRTTWTGNIGVIMQRYNVSKLIEKWGIDDATMVSSGAIYKDAGSMTKPENPRDRAYLQGLMDSAFAEFKQVVKDGRGTRLTQSIDAIANGKVYTADEAKTLGLVDGTGGHDEAVAYLKSLPGLSKLHLVKLEESEGLASLLGASTNLKTGETNVKLDLSPALESLLSPRPLYLWHP